jgi:hypothetical protein
MVIVSLSTVMDAREYTAVPVRLAKDAFLHDLIQRPHHSWGASNQAFKGRTQVRRQFESNIRSL